MCVINESVPRNANGYRRGYREIIMYIGVTAADRTLSDQRKYNYRVFIYSNEHNNGWLFERYCNGKRLDGSITNERRGSNERGVVRELRRPCQKKRIVTCT